MNDKTDYLPEIEEPPVSNVNVVINEEVGSDGPVDDVEVDDDKVDEEQVEEEPVPEVKPRKKLEQKEIFKPPKVQEVISSTTGKPKKKMSQKQLDHLAKIRKKAMETRQRNKKLREEGQAVPVTKKVEKENVRIQEKIMNPLQMGEAFYITKIYSELNNVQGVIDTKSVTLKNLTGGAYSEVNYDIFSNMSPDGRYLVCPANVTFEIKFPNNDIKGTVR